MTSKLDGEGRERNVKMLWRSTDGKHWEQAPCYYGSILYHTSIPPGEVYELGGNLYRNEPPKEVNDGRQHDRAND